MANEFLNLVRASDASALGGPRNKAILSMLADRANKLTGRAFPGVQRLVWESGYSRGTVITALNELQRCGAIAKVNPPSAARGRATVYRINDEYLRSIAKPFQRLMRVGLNHEPIDNVRKGSGIGPIAGKRTYDIAAVRVQSTDGLGSSGTTPQVQGTVAIGLAFDPQPTINPDSKTPRQPQWSSSSKEHALRWLKELVAMSLGCNPPKLYGEEDLCQEAESIVELLDTDVARFLWEIFASNCFYPRHDDDDIEPFDDVAGDSSEAKAEPIAEPTEPFQQAEMVDLVYELADLFWTVMGPEAESEDYRIDGAGTVFSLCGRWLFRYGYSFTEIKAAMYRAGTEAATKTVGHPAGYMFMAVPRLLRLHRGGCDEHDLKVY